MKEALLTQPTTFTLEPKQGPRIQATLQDDLLQVNLDGHVVLRLALRERSPKALVAVLQRLENQDARPLRWALLGALHLVFTADLQIQQLSVDFSEAPQALAALLRSGIGRRGEDTSAICSRELFLQQADLWLIGEPSSAYPLAYTLSNGRRHPQRPPRNEDTVYQRFIPALGKTFSLRTLNAELDLERLHRWMNNPRVAKFWGEDGDLDKHRAFIVGALADPRNHPLIASLDGEPFAYFEAYWAKEDRIAPFYDVGDYDRGIHMLVGEDAVRGAHIVAAWLPSLLHYLFLDDVRTQVVVCEPRADNERMIGYLQRYGFAYRKQFDFPHKRAALMTLEREVFATGTWLTGTASPFPAK
ncbi:GNAT family N-acetyltransferase [Jeongeupia wiesaeckerbachi]|uniref:GNAT family N-acetyltransferase n=1 Tax=Jeongeupia wiesaeckerbachi TaxID=3051218 RepID=UPI003D806C42